MACSQTLMGIAASCETNVGGIREVYIANYDDVATIGISSGKINSITMATGKKFKKYNFKKNTASLNSTLNTDAANGINFVQSDLAMSFAKQDTAKRIEMAALVLGELRVMVRDSNGKLWFLGYEEYVAATAGTAETGTSRTDGNKYNITLTDYSSTNPYEILEGTGGVNLSQIVDDGSTPPAPSTPWSHLIYEQKYAQNNGSNLILKAGSYFTAEDLGHPLSEIYDVEFTDEWVAVPYTIADGKCTITSDVEYDAWTSAGGTVDCYIYIAAEDEEWTVESTKIEKTISPWAALGIKMYPQNQGNNVGTMFATLDTAEDNIFPLSLFGAESISDITSMSIHWSDECGDESDNELTYIASGTNSVKITAVDGPWNVQGTDGGSNIYSPLIRWTDASEDEYYSPLVREMNVPNNTPFPDVTFIYDKDEQTITVGGYFTQSQLSRCGIDSTYSLSIVEDEKLLNGYQLCTEETAIEMVNIPITFANNKYTITETEIDVAYIAEPDSHIRGEISLVFSKTGSVKTLNIFGENIYIPE